jgi:type I restriction enzyme S subunit
MAFKDFRTLNKILQKDKTITYGIVQPGEFDANGIVMIRSQDYSNGWKKKTELFKVSIEIERPYIRSRVKKGDILITVVGANIGKIAVVPEELDSANISRSVARISIDSSKSNPEFVRFYLESRIESLLHINKVGGAQPVLNLDDLRLFRIPSPSLPEQNAIAQVLSTADTAIKTTEKLIAQKELRKKWLMQQLLTGKKRLKGFDGEVKLKVVEHYLQEISERNKDLKISNVLSVTNSRGFINQSDQFDRVVASEDATNYKIVRKEQFAYNPSRVNVGSLDLLRDFESGILSPMYVVFETDKSQLLPDYFYYQLKTQWFYGHIPMFVQGSVRDSLSFDGLCSMKFFIPSIEEQIAIAQVLQAADKEIRLLKAKAEKLREQKKGLMQVLLTGKVRLKINNT